MLCVFIGECYVASNECDEPTSVRTVKLCALGVLALGV